MFNIRRKNKKGAGLVDYGLLVGMITVVSMFAVKDTGEEVKATYCGSQTGLAAVGFSESNSVCSPPEISVAGGTLSSSNGERTIASSAGLVSLVPFSGGSPTWTLSGGSLPPGASIDGASGALVGTPTAIGTYTFDVDIVIEDVSATQTFEITIDESYTLTTYTPRAMYGTPTPTDALS